MLRLRVVRWTNRTPTSRSSAAMRRLTVVLGMPSRRAAAVKLGDADGIDRATQMFIPIRFDGQCFAIRELEARGVHRQTGRVRTDLAGLCAKVTTNGMDQLNAHPQLGDRHDSAGSRGPSPTRPGV